MESAQNLPQAGRAARPRHRSVVGPAILIGLGLLFLAQNFGMLSGEVWLNIWRLWPLLLVLAGIDLILGRTGWAGSIALVVTILVIGVAVAWTTTIAQVPSWWSDDGRVVSGVGGVQTLVEELGDARLARIELRHGFGRLSVDALPAEATELMRTELASDDDHVIDRRIERRGDRVEISLSPRRDWPAFFRADARDDWTIQLSPSVPLELLVDSGASDLDLNLRELAVIRLEVKAGASGVKITLPQSAGRTEARVRAGAAGIAVTIPEGVAARIRARSGLSDTSIDETRFPRFGSYYQSPNYEGAPNRVDLDIESGVSGLSIH